MFELKQKLVAVLGAGLEGISSATYLKNQGAFVTLIDQKSQENFPPEIISRINELGIKTVFGESALEQIGNFEVLVRTPGIRPDIPAIEAAVGKGSLLTSNTKIFFDNSPSQIIGVTGTKGKGTTSTLIYKILKASGKSAYLGGNIGTPALDLLPQLSANDFVVLELSSFQLFDLDKSPHIAVVLMVTREHLDWHKNEEDYKQAKKNIVKFQAPSGFAIISVDYPNSKEFLTEGQGKKIEVSTQQALNSGVFISGTSFYRRVGIAAERVMETSEVGLLGKHNLENVAAAIGAVSALGIDVNTIERTVKEFKGLEHRLEFVREKDGVEFYNDSFSTTPETAIAAIKSFEKSEIVILGGSDKGSDYTELGKTIVEAKNLKGIVLIGQMASKIKEAIVKAGEFNGEIKEGAQNIEEIVSQAKTLTKSGHVVILTPACASFDMFKNYKNRGEEFKRVVNSL